MSIKKTLHGTGVAIVTPFNRNKSVDFASLGKLIDHLIKNGVNYIVSLGTTGETPTLTEQEQKEIVKFTIDKVNSRVPIVVGVGGNDTQKVIEQFSWFDFSKITAILSSSPNYNKPSQEGIYQHYKSLAKTSPKPIILYNVPGRTGSNILAETVIRLAKDFKNIQGIKEASGNMVQCMHIIKNRPADFLVVSGDDHITLPLIACGMDGVISVAANCFPKDFCNLVQLALKNEFEKAQAIQNQLLEGFDLLFAENNPAGVKAFLAYTKIIKNELRLPLVPLSEAVQEKVNNWSQQYF